MEQSASRTSRGMLAAPDGLIAASASASASACGTTGDTEHIHVMYRSLISSLSPLPLTTHGRVMGRMSATGVTEGERFTFGCEGGTRLWVLYDVRDQAGISGLGPTRAIPVATPPHPVHRTTEFVRRAGPEVLGPGCVVCGAPAPTSRLLFLRLPCSPCSPLPLSPRDLRRPSAPTPPGLPATADAPDARSAGALRAGQRALVTRIRIFIRDNLGDAHLTPGAIASAHHISLRYLHKLFREDGHTVAGWIREHRLEQCRRDLADPRLGARPIHAIASRWGFTSPAHFSQVFRDAYGLSPSRFRRQCVTVHAD